MRTLGDYSTHGGFRSVGNGCNHNYPKHTTSEIPLPPPETPTRRFDSIQGVSREQDDLPLTTLSFVPPNISNPPPHRRPPNTFWLDNSANSCSTCRAHPHPTDQISSIQTNENRRWRTNKQKKEQIWYCYKHGRTSHTSSILIYPGRSSSNMTSEGKKFRCALPRMLQ